MARLPRISSKLVSKIESILADAKKLDPASNTIAAEFEEMCKRLGLSNPPALYSHPYWPGEGALSSHNAILLSEAFFEKEPHIRKFALSHELGHILRNDIGASKKAAEHATDRIALQITGSNVGAVAFVKNVERAFNEDLQMFKLPGTTPMGRWANSIIEAGKKKQLRVQYGTHEERLANILATDMTDKTHVARLVQQHNERSFLPLP